MIEDYSIILDTSSVISGTLNKGCLRKRVDVVSFIHD